MDKPLPRWYVSTKKRLEHIFIPDNFKGVVEESQSPCGKFFFVVNKYSTDPRWYYYHGFICNKNGFDPSWCEVRSTATQFWHCWVVQDDKPYVVCNEDEQGYTVIDVTARKLHPYKAPGGLSFCWREVKPSPDGKWLAVQGDYMYMKREVCLFDFSKPTEVPLPKVCRLDANLESGYCVLKGWNGCKVIMDHIKPNQEAATVEVCVDNGHD